jgi:tetratricopeptide (TPR) repeat protein
MSLNQYDNAIKDFTRAINDHPRVSYFNNRAWAYHLKGEDAKGLSDAKKAVTMTPDNADFIETRAEIYEKLNQNDEAIADYRASLKLDPNDDHSKQGLKRLNAAQ